MICLVFGVFLSKSVVQGTIVYFKRTSPAFLRKEFYFSVRRLA